MHLHLTKNPFAGRLPHLCGATLNRRRKSLSVEEKVLEKVVLGLSDGVDSAVAARVLMDRGYEVHGVYLDIAGADARADALASAERLGVELQVADIHEELNRHVCEPFLRAYLAGRTPNPCIGCNPEVKFPSLLRRADELGARLIATGHYARCDGQNLYMGNPDNDQSYMLARLRPEQVSRLLLPLGAYQKKRVREMAAEMGLRVAGKPDSRENCFIRGQTYAEWLESRAAMPGPGAARLGDEVIGMHEGIHHYTVGQRWPELWHERRLYVSAIHAESNELELCLWDDLFRRKFDIANLSFVNGSAPGNEFRAAVRVRHTRWETPACIVTLTEHGAHVVTDEPVRAPAPGQAAALYDGERLLGGGYIV